MEHVIGCKTSYKAWKCLQERFASVSMVRVNQLKTELHTAQKGGDSVDKFLMRLKGIKDQLVSAGEKVTDNDFIITVLFGLPADFEMIKTVILARDSPMSIKDFRAQLLVAEGSIESRMHSLSSSMSAMVVQGEGLGLQGFQGYEHGESSNSQRSQVSLSNDQFGNNFQRGNGFNDQFGSNFQGGNGFSGIGNGNGSRDFPSSQRGNFNNRKFGNGFHQDLITEMGIMVTLEVVRVAGYEYASNGFTSTNSSAGHGNYKSNWNGNTNSKYSVSLECHICSRREHTAPNCYYRAESGYVICQICGKRGHIALECFHKNNFAYQGNPPPPPSVVAMTAQANVTQTEGSGVGFIAEENWILDSGQGNKEDTVHRDK
ncbi:uncharacterized protein [Malus domestica]|uniref:uncharacterized protein isoform X1 n=1 Tax=Malus domestica TaxID=3750 RepID=UPI00397586D6